MNLFPAIKGGARATGTGSLSKLGRSSEQLKNTGIVLNMFAGAKSFARAMIGRGDYTQSLRQSMFSGSKGQEYLSQLRRMETTPKGAWGKSWLKDARSARKGAIAESVGMKAGSKGISAAMHQKESMMRLGQVAAGVGLYAGVTSVTDTDFTTKLGFGAGYAYGMSRFRGGRMGGLKALGAGLTGAIGVAPIF